MHPHHTGIELIGSVKRAFSHEAICHRGLILWAKGLKLHLDIRNHRCAAACKDERFLHFGSNESAFHVLFADLECRTIGCGIFCLS